jgi:hypothetical protein
VSLILDALKRLEREKEAGPPGVVVVGQVPWGRGGRRRVALLAALLAAAALAVGVFVLSRRSPGTPYATPVATPAAPSARAEASPSATVEAPPVSATRTEAAPTPPPVRRLELPETRPAAVESPRPVPTPPARELRLNAISVRDGAPIALLNDRLVREGDSFDGVRILRIGEAEVEVEVDGERRILRF